jgi:Protein of unknown function (DUF3311)
MANAWHKHRKEYWKLLLAIPFIALLWVPFYNFVEPEVAGIPFFYWYQFLWVFISSALTYLVHVKTDN